METLDLFRLFVNVPELKPRTDAEKVTDEAVRAFITDKKYEIPKDVRNKIKDFMKIKSDSFRYLSLSNFLTRSESSQKKINVGGSQKSLNTAFGEIFSQYLYYPTGKIQDTEKKAKELMNKPIIYSNLSGRSLGKISFGGIVPRLLKISVKAWKKLKKSHCLTMLSVIYTEADLAVNSPLIYCLINGTPENLDEVSIFIKDVTVPCEGISIRELSSKEQSGVWFSIINSIANHKDYGKYGEQIDKMIDQSEKKFEKKGQQSGKFYVLSIGFDDDTMENLAFVPETYAQYLVPLLLKGISLYRCFTYFLISKSLGKESLRIDISNLNGPVKDEIKEFISKI